MKNSSIKFTLAFLSFLIGVSAAGLWYLSRIEADSQRSFSKALSSMPPLNLAIENPCDYPQPHYRELEAKEAVILAECFINQNGYTDLPPIADKSKLTPENLFPGTDEVGMKMRHDSLEGRAYSYYRSEIYGGSWVVMFRYKPHPDVVEFYGERMKNIGRAVVMDYCGNRLRVQHSDYPLRMPEAIILDH